jgi:outer membrane receptor protein involved in Fe transport
VFDITGYRANDGDTRGTVFAKVSVPQGISLWTVRGTYYKADWDAPGFLNVASVMAGTVKATDRDPSAPRLWGKGDRTSIVFTRRPAKGEAGLHLSAAVEDYSRTRALGANVTDFNVQMDDRWFAQARAVENVVIGARAGIALGIELRRDRGDSINHRWPGGVPGANYTWNQDLDLWTYGVFAQGQVKPIDTVKLIGGARFDTFDYDITNRKLPAASVNYTEGVATPRGGVVWTPIKALDVFTNVGQGFRSPNQTEISPSGALGPLGAAGGTAFPTLAVPRVRSYDFGATASMTDRWSVTVAGYHTFNENEILQVAPGVFDSVGDTTRKGWDLESRVEIANGTSVYGSLAEIATARINNPPPNAASLFLVPKHMVKGGIAHALPLPRGQLLLNGDGFYMSGIPYFTGPSLFLSGVSRPYARYDLRGTYEIGPVQYTAYGTFQPNDFSSEPISVIAAGFFYDPRPKAEFGLSVRYRY